jgi:hypothetical protein
MKAIIAAVLFCLSGTAFAQHHGHGFRHHNFHHRHHWHHGHGWVVPALIGGTVVYMATRPNPVIVNQPPQTVVLEPNQVMINGIVYTKQTMIINGVDTEVLVKQ